MHGHAVAVDRFDQQVTALFQRCGTEECHAADQAVQVLDRCLRVQAVGGLFLMSADAVKYLFQRPFFWREFLEQAWFIASVSIMPALLMAIPFCMMFVYQINILLAEIGAVDLSGAGAGVAIIREIGPVVTVLVVAGAGSTAICADLGSRTIREEIDAMKVLGIDPIQRLCVPRVLASTP